MRFWQSPYSFAIDYWIKLLVSSSPDTATLLAALLSLSISSSSYIFSIKITYRQFELASVEAVDWAEDCAQDRGLGLLVS